MPLEYSQRHFLRCVAESNHCSRFCRPVPSHSANAPSSIGLQRYGFFPKLQIYSKKIEECRKTGYST